MKKYISEVNSVMTAPQFEYVLNAGDLGLTPYALLQNPRIKNWVLLNNFFK